MDIHSHIIDKDTKNNVEYIQSFLIPGAHRFREELGLPGPADFMFPISLMVMTHIGILIPGY